MESLPQWPKYLVAAGMALAGFGLFALLLHKYTGLRLGRLPLDFSLERDGFSFYFPLGTCILLSVLLTIVAWFMSGSK